MKPLAVQCPARIRTALKRLAPAAGFSEEFTPEYGNDF